MKGPGLAWFHARLERALSGRLWIPRVVVGSLLIACTFSVPGFEQGGRRAERAWRIKWPPVVAEKVGDPLRDMARRFEEGSNEAKRTFRISVPGFAYATRSGVPGAYLFNGLCGYVALHVAAGLGALLLGSRAGGAYVTLLLASTYFGTAALKDYFGWFDSTAFAFLLAALAARRPGWRAAALLVAFFTDERALLVSPAIVLAAAAAGTAPGAAPLGRWREAAAAVAAALLAYLAIRVSLTLAFDMKNATQGIDLANFVHHVPALPLGLWAPFEGGWLLFGWGLRRLAAERGRLRSLSFAAAGYCLAYLLACLTVHDETRSMSYAFVFLFPLLAALRPRVAGSRLLDQLLLAAALSAVIPNVFVWKTFEYETNVVFWWLGI